MKDDLRIEGVRSLLRDGLQMEAGSTLLVLHQDEFSDLASFIGEIAKSFLINIDQRRFSSQDFVGRYPSAFSPSRLGEAAPTPQGIILLIESSVQTTRGRLEFLRDIQATGRRWRVASMAGVTLPDMALSASPIDEIKAQCFRVFIALARAPFVSIRTFSPWGDEDILVVPISEFCPNISTGAIDPGSWGNFPSGETFVVPNPYSSWGWITLRGSFPRYVLQNHEWIRFEISRGRLRYKSIEASSAHLKNEFIRLFLRSGGRTAVKNANVLSELGIGTNPSVTRLTGNPIFDQKQTGTIHLGFGSNRQFKGPIASDVHHDITCLGASLETPSVKIVKEGRLIITDEQAAPSLSLAGSLYRSSHKLFKDSQRASYEFNDISEKLYLTYSPYRGGPITVAIDSTGVTNIAKWILNEARTHRSIDFKALAARLPKRFDPNAAEGVFKGLVELGLLEVVSGKRNR